MPLAAIARAGRRARRRVLGRRLGRQREAALVADPSGDVRGGEPRVVHRVIVEGAAPRRPSVAVELLDTGHRAEGALDRQIVRLARQRTAAACHAATSGGGNRASGGEWQVAMSAGSRTAAAAAARGGHDGEEEEKAARVDAVCF